MRDHSTNDLALYAWFATITWLILICQAFPFKRPRPALAAVQSDFSSAPSRFQESIPDWTPTMMKKIPQIALTAWLLTVRPRLRIDGHRDRALGRSSQQEERRRRENNFFSRSASTSNAPRDEIRRSGKPLTLRFSFWFFGWHKRITMGFRQTLQMRSKL